MRGLTLVEILMALVVFAIGAVGLLSLTLGIAHFGESSRNLTQAIADLQVVLAAMRDTSTTGLSAVTSTDWGQWAFNNHLTNLPNESVTVTYVDPNADPLGVAIGVDWTERLRARSVTVDTLITQR